MKCTPTIKTFIIIFNLFILANQRSFAQKNLVDITYDKSELNYAKKIDTIIKNIKFKKINISLVKKFEKKTRDRNNLFSNYNLLLKDIISVAEIKKFQDFFVCKNILNKNYRSGYSKNPEDKFNIYIKQYCYYKFLNVYRKLKNHETREEDKLFKKYIDHYLFPLKREFITFLKKISHKKKLQEFVTEKILASYSANLHHVDARILPYLAITTNLTNYIQRTGLYDKEFKKFSHKKILTLSRKIRSKNYIRTTSHAQLKKDTNYLIKFSKNNQDIIDNDFMRKILIITGRKLLVNNKDSLSQKFFKEALNFTSPSNNDDTVFSYLWSDIVKKKYSKANKTIEHLNLHGKFHDLSMRLKFWIAYVSDKMKKMKLAQHYYQSIIELNPIHYYSILSMKNLKKSSNTLNVKNYITNPLYLQDQIPLEEYSEKLIKSIKRIKIFNELKFSDLINQEIYHLNQSPLQDFFTNYKMYPKSSDGELRENITLKIASLLNKGDNYLNSFILIHKKIIKNGNKVNIDILKTLFPTPYIKEVEDIVPKNIDPYIILSLIRQESAFNPSAKSRVGARGLMQLMPATARRIKSSVSSQSLNKPEMNLKIGIQHFTDLYSEYDKNLIHTLAAYNAGRTRVNRWKKEIFKDMPPLYMIESIPFKETCLYVKLIFRNLFFYTFINKNENQPEKEIKLMDSFFQKG